MTKDIDYAQTIHLPKTDFPRRAGLAQKEPLIQARWEKMGLYEKQRAASQGREKFVLHMGPPFANGDIHLGHVLSTVLKDVVCRSHQMLGYDAPLVPGFDCHGLPIDPEFPPECGFCIFLSWFCLRKRRQVVPRKQRCGCERG